MSSVRSDDVGPEDVAAGLVTVVIPTHNRRDLLPEAVASVRRQTVSWELVVVDDGSTDGTWEWLESLKDDRVRAFRHEEPRERAAARNRGLREARGTGVLFLDDDDVLLPGALAILVDALAARPAAGAVVGGFELVSEQGVYRPPGPRRAFQCQPWREAFGGWCGLQGQALFRTSALRRVGGYAAGLEPSEDQDLWIRFALDHPVLFLPERTCRIRCHPDQGSRAEEQERLTELQTRLRIANLERLGDERRQPARRAVRFWRFWRLSVHAYTRGRTREFRRHLLAAARTDPELIRSPLFRTGLARKVLLSFLPPRILEGLRRVKRRLGRGVLAD